MSDDIAFRILNGARARSSSRRWDPREMSSAAQKELLRGNRLENFARQHRDASQDPMTLDLVGWDENMARGSAWPWCSKCKTIVRAVEVGRTDKEAIVKVRCHGVHEEMRIAKPYRGVDEADEGWLRRRIKHLVFFAE